MALSVGVLALVGCGGGNESRDLSAQPVVLAKNDVLGSKLLLADCASGSGHCRGGVRGETREFISSIKRDGVLLSTSFVLKEIQEAIDDVNQCQGCLHDLHVLRKGVVP
jgi:hypothetical protein